MEVDEATIVTASTKRGASEDPQDAAKRLRTDDADAMDTVDQTAELACWLRMLPELAAATEPASLTVAGF